MPFFQKRFLQLFLLIKIGNSKSIVFPSPWTATLTCWAGLCLFDVKKADQMLSVAGKASSKITELKKFSLLTEMTDPTSRQRERPTSIKEYMSTEINIRS
jgi:hypothetical protein